MGERTGYEPGTFCWVDAQATDPEAAKSFYTGMFGWEYEDMPIDEGTYYSMARIDGKDVAAISPLPARLREQQIPPHWNSYVSVESVDATAARARELGGSVLFEPFDVFTAGRMAVIADPQGGVLQLWQPGDHPGSALVNVPGAFTWNDLTAPDPHAAARFYGDLFGWEFEEMPVGDGSVYLVIRNRGRSNGGIMSQPEELAGAPPFWNVYFGVEDVRGATSKAESLGGSLLAGPIEVPEGEFAVLRDPQGAPFSVYAGTFDD
ncbi:MAG: VOC family protein [Thermoleophilaceae bacterium]|nr:VOC family protein [Thermoleophilaceae bacterium]